MNEPLPEWMPLAFFLGVAFAIGLACLIACWQDYRDRKRVTWGPNER